MHCLIHQSGYWRAGNHTAIIYECPLKNSCLGGPHSDCSDGHEGPLCAVCSHPQYGLNHRTKRCEQCPPRFRILLSWCLCVVCIGMLLMFAVLKKGSLAKRVQSLNHGFVRDSSRFIKIKMVISTLQLLTQFPASAMRIPRVFKSMLAWLVFVNLDFFTWFSLPCLFPGYRNEMLVATIVPMVVCSTLLCLWVCSIISERTAIDWTLLYLFFIHPGLSGQ